MDRENSTVSLMMRWITKNEGMQRRGRVGRVGPGRVYRLVPMSFYESFACAGVPDIKNSPIENTVLNAKSLRLGDPVSVLSQAIEPPLKYEIKHAVKLLKEAGAMTYTVNGVFSDCDGDMTFLGNLMSRMPMGYQASKLVALGYACGIPEDAAVVGKFFFM